MGKFVDLTGQRFGKLVVLERAPNIGRMTAWKCRCDCGNETVKKGIYLTQGDTKSCGCECGRQPIDEIGNRYGRLLVVGESDRNYHGTKRWICKCDCGEVVSVTGADLRKGHTTSCGCYHREMFGEMASSRKTHGKSKQRLYKIWSSMKTRCYDTNSDFYKYYGGRGIRICDEWMGSDGFQHFWDWAYANGYDENAKKGQCTIDRIDVNGNYEPSNCRWTTNLQQANNKRTNHFVTIGNEKRTISEWSRISGISKGVIRQRLQNGWSAEKAVFHKLMRNRRKTNESNEHTRAY